MGGSISNSEARFSETYDLAGGLTLTLQDGTRKDLKYLVEVEDEPESIPSEGKDPRTPSSHLALSSSLIFKGQRTGLSPEQEISTSEGGNISGGGVDGLVYVLRLRNPDGGDMNGSTFYPSERGLLHLTAYTDTFLSKAVSHYGCFLDPKVIHKFQTSQDHKRWAELIVGFGLLVTPAPTTSLGYTTATPAAFRDAVKYQSSPTSASVYLKNGFSVTCYYPIPKARLGVSEGEDSEAAPIWPQQTLSYQRVRFSTAMEGTAQVPGLRPHVPLKLYKFAGTFTEERKKHKMIVQTKSSDVPIGQTEWGKIPVVDLVGKQMENCIEVTGVATFEKLEDNFYGVPFFGKTELIEE